MESRNATFFDDVFLRKEVQENCSLERIIEVSSNDHHQSGDNKVEFRMSKREKTTKKLGPDFLTYLLENKPQTYFKAMSCLKFFYWKEVVNSKIKFIMNNHTWKLVNLSLGSTPLGHK
jgi:hypothetical protein